MSEEEKLAPGLHLQLDGRVLVVDVDDQGTETVEELDGATALRCILYCLEEGLNLLEEKEDNEE